MPDPLPAARSRPVFLDPLRIRLPVAGVVSILHRVTGILMFLAVPFAIYALDLSLRSPEGFARVRDWLAGGWGRALLLLAVWGLAHHLLAGIRFLLIDLDLGVERGTMRRTAWGVHLGALAILALTAGWLL
jgi:succinate dehydrogenase / fumarate reductase cytochrome b subunit